MVVCQPSLSFHLHPTLSLKQATRQRVGPFSLDTFFMNIRMYQPICFLVRLLPRLIISKLIIIRTYFNHN